MTPYSPLTKERFLELAAEYGCNSFLASDLWFVRPVQKAHDEEDIVKGNFEMMKRDGWIERNNGAAERLLRHEWEPTAKGRCARCGNNKRSPFHNTEPFRVIEAVNPTGDL